MVFARNEESLELLPTIATPPEMFPETVLLKALIGAF